MEEEEERKRVYGERRAFTDVGGRQTAQKGSRARSRARIPKNEEERGRTRKNKREGTRHETRESRRDWRGHLPLQNRKTGSVTSLALACLRIDVLC